MMRNVSRYLALVVTVLTLLVSTVPVAADKSWPITSPRGGKITLVIRDSALQNFRIYDLDFVDQGKNFSITAEPARQSQMSQTLEIEFLSGDVLVQKEYVNIGSERTQAALPCPGKFDRIVIQ
jgi:hypothetical protein